MIASALRELAALQQLGVPLDEALEAVRPADEPSWEKLIGHVRAGSSLGQAMERTGAPFPPVLARATAENLAELAWALDKDSRARRALWYTVQYPRWLALATLVLLWVLAYVVKFSFGELLSGMNLHLPLLTRVLLNGLPIYLVLATFVLGSLVLAPAQLLWYASWNRSLAVAGWLRWVDVLTACGTPLPEACRLASCTEVAGVDGELARGDRLADALARRPGLERVAWLVQRAEQAGFPPGALRRIADVLTRELELSQEVHLRLLEPLLVTLLGGLVAAVLMGLFLPLYQLIGNLG